MIKKLKYALNELDKKYNLRIFPRDRILRAESSDFTYIEKKKLFLGYSSFNYDMHYYLTKFHHKQRTYFCFQATKLTKTFEHESYIFITDNKKKTIVRIRAKDYGLERFYSPQVITLKGRTSLFFSGKKGTKKYLYRLPLKDLKPSKKALLLKEGIKEQYIHIEGKKAYIFYTTDRTRSIHLLSTKDFISYTKKRIIFHAKEKYLLLDNPFLFKEKEIYYLFCCLSKVPVIGSKIVCFTSTDMKTFRQNQFEMKSTLKKYEGEGVEMPAVYKENNKYAIYYTGYNGKHLLKPLTVRNSKKAGEVITP